MSQPENSKPEKRGKKARIIGGWVLSVIVVVALVLLFYPGLESPVSIPPIVQLKESGAERWYTQEQVAQGREIFSRHCATCHGKNAEATPDWRKTDAEGNYPPPPLNGTAHAWHHSLSVLRETIQQGGIPLGGVMPGFADKLSLEETDAVIAWFQSLWPDELYQAWYRMEKESQ